MTMKISDFSIMISAWGSHYCTPQELVDVCQHAEDLGFHSIGVPHVPILPGPDDFPAGPETDPFSVSISKPFKFFSRDRQYSQHDPLVLVPIALHATKRIRIGFNVVVTPWHHPYQWAKYMASLDAASNGRFIAGFGLGYVPNFPGALRTTDSIGINSRKRGAMSDEALEYITRLWTSDEPVSFEGAYYSGHDLVVDPKPVQKPYPELWWAGNVPAAIPRCLKYATYLEIGYPMLSAARNLALQLKQQAEHHKSTCKFAALVYTYVAPGARPDACLIDDYFEVTHPGREETVSMAVGGPEHCAQVLRAFHDAGVDHFALDLQRHGRDPITTHHEQMELFVRDVIPLLS
jgi:alkanesulfonate monooxygenase SsuD/methylene tetrahydromethanopterin reductase-like flavin-dependent oxidoreductase (luciferase family)